MFSLQQSMYCLLLLRQYEQNVMKKIEKDLTDNNGTFQRVM